MNNQRGHVLLVMLGFICGFSVLIFAYSAYDDKRIAKEKAIKETQKAVKEKQEARRENQKIYEQQLEDYQKSLDDYNEGRKNHYASERERVEAFTKNRQRNSEYNNNKEKNIQKDVDYLYALKREFDNKMSFAKATSRAHLDPVKDELSQIKSKISAAHVSGCSSMAKRHLRTYARHHITSINIYQDAKTGGFGFAETTRIDNEVKQADEAIQRFNERIEQCKKL